MIDERVLANDLCEEEREFTAKVRRMLVTENPNPRRIGCSALSSDIKALAWHGTIESELDQILDHLMQCSPCFRDHRKYKRQYKIYRWLQGIRTLMNFSLRARVAWVAGAMLLVLSLSLIWIYRKESGANKGKDSGSENVAEQVTRNISDPTKTLRSAPIEEHENVTLSLESNLRGGVPAEMRRRIAPRVLPRGRLSLVVQLPKGARAGQYLIRLASHDRILIQAKGEAITDQSELTRLELLNFDTSGVPAGRYQLGLKKDQSDWSEFEVTVK